MPERGTEQAWWRRGPGGSLGATFLLLTVTVVCFEFVIMSLVIPRLPSGLPGWAVGLVDASLLGFGLSLSIGPLVVSPLRRRLRRHRERLARCVAQTVLAEGDGYHRAMVACLGEQLDAAFVGVGELMPGLRVRTIASWTPDGHAGPMEYALAGTPCELVAKGEPHCMGRGAASCFPPGTLPADLRAESYIGVPIMNGGGEVIGIVAVVRVRPLDDPDEALTLIQLLAARSGAEIQRSRAVRREAALRRRQDAIMRLIDESTIVSTTDASGRITHVNDLFCQVAGFTREELIGENHRVVNSGHHPKRLWTDLYRKAAAGEVWQATVRNRRKDGSYYWLSAGATGILGENGTLEEIVSVRHDVTEIVEAERRARILVASVESAPAAICVADAEGRVVLSNKVFRAVCGLAGQGPDRPELAGLIEDPEICAQVSAALASGQHLNRRISVRRRAPDQAPAGDPTRPPGPEDRCWFQMEFSPIRDQDSETGHFICVLRDIDDQVREEDRLRLEAEGRRVQLEIAAALGEESAELPERLARCVRSLIMLDGLGLRAKGAVFLTEDGSPRLCIAEGDLGADFFQADGRAGDGRRLCARALDAARQGEFEVIVTDECSCDPGPRPARDPAHGHYVVPLHWVGRCEGVLVLYTDPYPVQRRERIELLSRIGEQMGAAIIRDRLRTIAQREEREAALASDFTALRAACAAVLNSPNKPIAERVHEALDYVSSASNLGFRGSASAFVHDDTGMRRLAQCGSGEPPEAVTLPLVHHGVALGELAIGVEPDAAGEAVRTEFLLVLTELLAAALHSDMLERLSARARQENRDTLFTLGREMRTPMTSIVAAADMLREEGVAETDRSELAEMIRRNADHLLSVVDNVLDLSGAGAKSRRRPSPDDESRVRELRGARVLLVEHLEGAGAAAAAALRAAGAMVEVSRRTEIGVAMALGALRAGRPHALVVMTERAASTEVEVAPRLLRENAYPSPIIVLADAVPDASVRLAEAGCDLVLPPGRGADDALVRAAAEMIGARADRRAA